MTKRNPHNLLFRDAPDERDLSVMRQFHVYITTIRAFMSINQLGVK